MTINEALALQKTLRQRLASLQGLRDQVSTKDRWLGEPEKISEPLYDVVAVDAKMAEIQSTLFRLTAAVVRANAMTQIDMDVDVEKLLAPLKRAE